MKITVDTHTHTNVSDHAYSTLEENLHAAKARGLEGIVMTNHGPLLGDGAHPWHFHASRHLPRVVDGVRLLKGCEANVMDDDGTLDLEDWVLRVLDVVIASFHEPCFPPTGDGAQVTRAWLNVLDNPYVTILGHMGNDRYHCDYEAVIRKAAQKNTLVEINNHSFLVRAKSDVNCREIACLCKQYGVGVVCSTDAHFSPEIGVVDDSIALLESIDFPEHLIMNTSLAKLEAYLQRRK